MLISPRIVNPTTINQPNNSSPDASAGSHGQLFVTDLHGPWYEWAVNGQLFIGSTLLAGTIIPINANNLVSTFTLWNPLGSGLNLELINYILGVENAAEVVGTIALAIQSNVGSKIAAPSSPTILVPQNGLIGGPPPPTTVLLSAGTLTGTPTILMPMFSFPATSGGTAGNTTFTFNGQVLLPPGALATVVGSAAQTQAMMQCFTWAETKVPA